MVKRKIHRTKRRTPGQKLKKIYKTVATKKNIAAAKSAAKKASAYSSALAKKHLTKANVKKAIEASKKATSYLSWLLHKKKKEPQRITMSIYRK